MGNGIDVYFNLNENGEVGNLVAGDKIEGVGDYKYHYKIESLDLLNQSPITVEQMEEWQAQFINQT